MACSSETSTGCTGAEMAACCTNTSFVSDDIFQQSVVVFDAYTHVIIFSLMVLLRLVARLLKSSTLRELLMSPIAFHIGLKLVLCVTPLYLYESI